MRNLIDLELTTSTTHAVAYLGDTIVATVQRKRLYGDGDRKTWTVYDAAGVELFQTNLGRLTIISRIAGILKAKAPTIERMEELAAVIHQEHYDARGDRYAEPAELAMHLADPLACIELVRDELTVRTGHVVRHRDLIVPASHMEMARAREGVEATKAYNERVQAERAKAAIITKPNTANYAPLSDAINMSAYRERLAAWENQKATAKPYWNPYASGADHKAVWDAAKAWEGKMAHVILKDGTSRRGKVERVTTANAANGESGCALNLYDGYSSGWCGCDFLFLEELEAPKAIELAPEAPKVVEAPKVDRMSAEAAFAEVRRIRDELTALTGKLDHLNHDIARDLNAARDDLFGAWSKLREAQKEDA